MSENFIYNSYLEMFKKLDKCWELTKDDALGGLLGSMNPHLFSTTEPIDSSMLKDWAFVHNAGPEMGKKYLSI